MPSPEGTTFPRPMPNERAEKDSAGTDVVDVDVGGPRGKDSPTLLIDWDRERYAGSVPRRVPLSVEEKEPTWVAYPHQRYVLCARHACGRIEQVYVMSLIGRRDSLIPGGSVERIVLDDRSVTVIVDGKPYLYAVESGTTLDLTTRRVMGGAAT